MQNVQCLSSCGTFFSKLLKVPVDFNVSFLQTPAGAIKVAHTLLGMICLTVIGHFCQFFHPLTGESLGLLCSNSAAFFLLVTYGCFVTSVINIISSLLSYFTASFLPKTAFEFGYHLTCCIMYLSSSLILLVNLILSNEDTFKEPAFEAKVAASVLGLINSILYGASTYFSFQSQRQMS